MKRFLSLIAGALVALAALSTPAYAVNAPLTINYTLPTVGCTTINGIVVTPCDNTPLTGGDAVDKVELFISTALIPDVPVGPPQITVNVPATTFTGAFSVNSGQTLHVRVRAHTASGFYSDLTTEVTKTVTVGVKPGEPTSVTLILNIS